MIRIKNNNIDSFAFTKIKEPSEFECDQVLDLKNCILICLDCTDSDIEKLDLKIHFPITDIFVFEECNKSVKLKYMDCMCRLEYTTQSGKEMIFARADEAYPSTFEHYTDYIFDPDEFYKPTTTEQLKEQIINTMKAMYDPNFIFDPSKVFIIQGN